MRCSSWVAQSFNELRARAELLALQPEDIAEHEDNLSKKGKDLIVDLIENPR